MWFPKVMSADMSLCGFFVFTFVLVVNLCSWYWRLLVNSSTIILIIWKWHTVTAVRCCKTVLLQWILYREVWEVSASYCSECVCVYVWGKGESVSQKSIHAKLLLDRPGKKRKEGSLGVTNNSAIPDVWIIPHKLYMESGSVYQYSTSMQVPCRSW